MAQFFDYPLNYGMNRADCTEYTDNDYNTYRGGHGVSYIPDCTSHIDSTGDGTGTARPFTHIFIKGSGITNYNIGFSGSTPAQLGRIIGFTIPANVTNDSSQTVSTTINGIQHQLLNIWPDWPDIIKQHDPALRNKPSTAPSATSITIEFIGTNMRLYQVMVLNEILNLGTDDIFSKLEYDSINLGSNQEDVRRRFSYMPPINNERDKWLVNYSALPRNGTETSSDTIADNVMDFIRKYKHFSFAPEYTRYPDRVFPAVWPQSSTQIRYLSRSKAAGRRINFSVREA